MTFIHQKIFKLTLILLVGFGLPSTSSAEVFTAIVSGDWSSAVTWGGNAPGTQIDDEDLIVIGVGVNVNLDVDVAITHSLAAINLDGTISGQSNLTFNSGVVTGTGNLIVEELIIASDALVLMTGKIVCEVLETTAPELTLVASVEVNSHLRLLSGICNIGSDANLMLMSDATIEIGGGSLVTLGGNFMAQGSYNLMYSGASSDTGAETEGGSVNNLTINLSSNDESVHIQNSLVVNGELNLMQGQLNLNGQHLTLSGNIAANGSGSISSDGNSSITINGSGQVGVLVMTNDNETIENCTIDIENGSVTLGSSLVVNGQLDLQNGELELAGQHLTLSGDIEGEGSATISGDVNANITFNGSGNMGLIVFTEGEEDLNNCSINITDGSVDIQSGLNIHGNLTLQSGHLILNDENLTIAASANINGGSQDSYIITEGEGHLVITLEAGGQGMIYPIGSQDDFFPCIIGQNQGASSTEIMARIAAGVWAEGTTGADVSQTASVVNHTWFISEADANATVDLDFEFFWNASAEVNDFDHENCYISHYEYGEWDVSTAVTAEVHANAMLSVRRENIGSLSPFRVADNKVTGLNEIEDIRFEMYPNPSVDQLILNTPTELQDEMVRVFSSNGQLLLEQRIQQGGKTIIDVSRLEKHNNYWLQVGNTVAKPFVKH